MDEQVRNFCCHYNAYVGPSTRRYRRPTTITTKNLSDYEMEMTSSYEDVPMVEIHIPHDRFQHLLEMRDHWNKTIQRCYHTNDVSNTLWAQYEKESRLRHQHPALQNLWEQYQAMLALVDNGN